MKRTIVLKVVAANEAEYAKVIARLISDPAVVGSYWTCATVRLGKQVLALTTAHPKFSTAVSLIKKVAA